MRNLLLKTKGIAPRCLTCASPTATTSGTGFYLPIEEPPRVRQEAQPIGETQFVDLINPPRSQTETETTCRSDHELLIHRLLPAATTTHHHLAIHSSASSPPTSLPRLHPRLPRELGPNTAFLLAQQISHRIRFIQNGRHPGIYVLGCVRAQHQKGPLHCGS